MRDKIDKLMFKYQTTKEMVKNEKTRLIECESRLKYTIEASRIVQELSTELQNSIHSKIAGVVSTCLTSIFDDPYEFKINFENKRGRTEASMVFIRNGHEIDPIDSCGGGVIDVASFALRLACICLSKPKVRKVMILDEPFKFVSSQHRTNIRHLLETISSDMNVQIIMVTHIDEIVCGDVIEIS